MKDKQQAGFPACCHKRGNIYMKKIIYFILCFAVAVFLFPANAFAAETTYTEGYLEYHIEDNAISISGYFGKESVVTVPASIAGYPVSEIASGAFSDCETVTEIRLPDSIMEIERDAFSGSQTVVYNSNISNSQDGGSGNGESGTSQGSGTESSGTGNTQGSDTGSSGTGSSQGRNEDDASQGSVSGNGASESLQESGNTGSSGNSGNRAEDDGTGHDPEDLLVTAEDAGDSTEAGLDEQEGSLDTASAEALSDEDEEISDDEESNGIVYIVAAVVIIVVLAVGGIIIYRKRRLD